MKKRFTQAVKSGAFLSTAVLISSVASASVTYQIENGGLESFNLTIDGINYNNALAGGILINRVSGDTTAPSSYVTVCTDIEGTLYLGNSYTYNSPAAFGSDNGVAPKWGSDNAPGFVTLDQTSASYAIQNAAALFNAHFAVLQGNNTTLKAALQLAIWDVLYDTGANGLVTGNRFSFSGSDANAILQADSWLIGLNGQTHYTGEILTPNPLNQGNADGEPPQELLIRDCAVPEATTWLAGALLLLPFALPGLRKLRRNSAANA